MFTGKTPFQGEQPAATLNGILNKEAPPMSEICSEVPLELERIVDKALAKNPAERYQHVDDMLVDLQRLKRQLFQPFGHDIIGRAAGFKNKTWKPLAIGSLVLSVLLLGVWLTRSEFQPDGPIAIAVADFVNHTEEKELDSLSGILITAMEQSHRLSVLTRARMYDLLKQMPEYSGAQVEKISSIDEKLAKRICNSIQLKALAIATIRKFDEIYTINLNVIDPSTEKHLFAAVEKGENKASIPTMIDRLSQKTQKELRIEDHDATESTLKVAQVTTSNLEAYYHFHRGMDFWYKLQEESAEEELRKAIAIDSTFGLPYALLASMYIGTPEEHLAKEPLAKAMTYLDETPERERYLIQAIHAYFEDGSRAAIDTLKKMEPLYPDDKRMYLGLGYFNLRANNKAEAENYFNKVLELDPSFEMAREFLSDIADKR
jgi:tetratricopeptide (TPR) repeat protein